MIDVIEKAIDCKLNVKPLLGILVHSDYWEGPCRAGRKEDLQHDAEMAAAQAKFARVREQLAGLAPQIHLLEPTFVPYDESFVVSEQITAEICADLEKTDCLVILNQRIPKIERFGKPVVSFTHAVSGTDTSAYLRSIGREAYYAIDHEELNEILYCMWVRKAVARTRALVLTAGQSPSWGLLSNIRDVEALRSSYGFEVVRQPFTEIFPLMDQVDSKEAQRLADRLMAGAQEVRVNPGDLPGDFAYYLAARAMMERYRCNAFSTSCVELCTSRIPFRRRFVPCIAHSLLKDEGIPSGCEEDLNALLAMAVLMYAADRPAFMGNPLYESDELLTLHHSVPCLHMNGYDCDQLSYSIYSFTQEGFGGKLQIDFAQNRDHQVTLGRFSPDGKKMVLKVGEVLQSEYKEIYCSPFYTIRMDDARAYLHHLEDFGHHQVLVFGNWEKRLRLLSQMMGFEIVRG